MIETTKKFQETINYVDAEQVEKHGREFAVHYCAYNFLKLKRTLEEKYGCTVTMETIYDKYGARRTEWYTISKTGFQLTAQMHFQDREKKSTSDYVRLTSLEVEINF